MKSKKHSQNSGTCIVRGYRSFVDSCTFTYKANFHNPKVEIHTRQNSYHFGRYVGKANLFCPKCFIPLTWTGEFTWENFIPVTEISVAKRDLGNRASAASHMDTSKVLRRKEWRGEISETEPARLSGPI